MYRVFYPLLSNVLCQASSNVLYNIFRSFGNTGTNQVIKNPKVVTGMLSAGNALALSITILTVMLTACDQAGQDAAQKREIKPAAKLSTDASQIARQTYQFLLSTEPLLKSQPVNIDQLEPQVFQPVRQLLLRWNTEIRQSDSVVGDQYTICRGALTSLDSWARSIQSQTAAQATRQAIFEKQKSLCENVLQSSVQQSQ